MMPNNTLSEQLVFGDFLNPDNLPCSNTLSYQLGGIGLSDPSAGLQYQVWQAQLVNATKSTSYVTISAPNTPTETLLTLGGISQISLAFDQNMKPALGLTVNGLAQLWWYDATIPGYTFITLPPGSYSPQVTLDDKRALSVEIAVTDIILVYMRNQNLYMRSQQDRFITEYYLATLEYYNPQVYKVGMCTTDRLLIQVNADLYG